VRTLSDAALVINNSLQRQYSYQVLLFDMLATGAPSTAQVVAGTAQTSAFSAFHLDVTEFVDQVNLEEPGDRRASHITFALTDRTDRFAPWGTDARFMKPGNFVRVIEGDTALPTADWTTTFTGPIRGQVGYETDRAGVRTTTRVAAYGRRATPKYNKMPFISKTFGRNVDYGTIALDIAIGTMGLGSDEITRADGTLGKVTQFVANSLVEMTPLEAIDKILEAVGKVADFDGAGLLRYYSRDVRRDADKRHTDLALIGRIAVPQAEVNGYNSISVVGLDKNITETQHPSQELARAEITVGFWRPRHTVKVQWSKDRSTRATDTFLKVITSVTEALILDIGNEEYNETDEFSGEIRVDIGGYVATLLVAIGVTLAAQALIGDTVVPVGGLTIPVGKILEAATLKLITTALATVSSGQYEIIGTVLIPVYKEISVVVTETGTPDYLLNRRELHNDFLNEQNELLNIAQLELFFEHAQAEPRTYTVVNDLQLEIGDIVQLPFGGGLRIWVDSFRKTISRGQIPLMDVSGYRAL
jgi:hypothetical protein